MDHDKHLARCVRLAREALDDGDDPFGSVLVDAGGTVLAEARNKERSLADPTAHPDLELAQWAWRTWSPGSARARPSTPPASTVQCAPRRTDGSGSGAIVFAASAAQLSEWRASWGLSASPVAALPVSDVVPGIDVTGPVAPYDEMMFELHQEAANRVGR